MTGAYVRIKREGKWDNIEIEYLTDEELEKFLTEKDSKKWAIFLAKFIRDNVFEQVEETDEHSHKHDL